MSKVAIVRTKPETVLQDVQKVMQLAGINDALEAGRTTIVKNNLSWHLMYPSANTTPWQLEGTILGLRGAGFEDLVCVENETVVTRARVGEMLNKQRPVCEHYRVAIKYNFEASDMKWQRYEPKASGPSSSVSSRCWATLNCWLRPSLRWWCSRWCSFRPVP